MYVYETGPATDGPIRLIIAGSRSFHDYEIGEKHFHDFAIKHGVRMGLPWTVIAVEPSQHGRCPRCGGHCPGSWARKSKERFGWSGAPFSWLKRIPPLAELESSKTDEPIKEPA